jgi:hypothetical protein
LHSAKAKKAATIAAAPNFLLVLLYLIISGGFNDIRMFKGVFSLGQNQPVLPENGK